jgi:hypothetical protein
MCIIMMKPEGKVISEEAMENSYSMNSDGFGFSYVNNGKIVTNKYMKYNKFVKGYRKAEAEFLHDTPFLIHFRACSKGVVHVSNAHPFVVNENQVFAHNGTIYGLPVDPNNKKSDTNLFNIHVLRKLPIGWESNSAIRILMEDYLGTNNRVVVLNSDKSYYIFNEELGKWDDGIWYSNEHYMGVFMRDAQGRAVKAEDLIRTQNQYARYQQWENEYDDYWNERIYGKAKEKDKEPVDNKVLHLPFVERESIKREAHNNTDVSDEVEFCCEFCGNALDDHFVVRNMEFDELHDFCGNCARTLVPMGGLEYVN